MPNLMAPALSRTSLKGDASEKLGNKENHRKRKAIASAKILSAELAGASLGAAPDIDRTNTVAREGGSRLAHIRV